jgi:hypothetical protein
VARSRLAAFLTRNGALTRWAPVADAGVMSMVIAPGGTRVVVGGHFGRLAGLVAPGLGAVDASTGAGRPFLVNRVVKNAGDDAGITSLTTDGKLVYGTGYSWEGDGNFEGTFAANPTTGAVVWIEDCRGDTYSAAAVGPVVYTVGHAHYCGNIGGFPESKPRSWQRAVAFTTVATGTVAKASRYQDFSGQPAPSILTWWPSLRAGMFTGQGQAAWSVVATSSYVVLGGEFTHVNGRAQQGLVRFATRTLAPNKQGPIATGAALGLTATPGAAGEVTLLWNRTWDRDNEMLTYVVTRVGDPTPVATRKARTSFWRTGTAAVTQTGVPAGSHTYRLTVKDPLGNAVTSEDVTVAVP